MSGRKKPVRPRSWTQYKVPLLLVEELQEQVHADLMRLPFWRRVYACWEIMWGPRTVRKAKARGWRLSRLSDPEPLAPEA